MLYRILHIPSGTYLRNSFTDNVGQDKKLANFHIFESSTKKETIKSLTMFINSWDHVAILEECEIESYIQLHNSNEGFTWFELMRKRKRYIEEYEIVKVSR